MDEQNSIAAFETRHLTSASGWYVRVTWPNGKRHHIPGFVSQLEAQRWIEGKARAWLSEQNNVPRDLVWPSRGGDDRRSLRIQLTPRGKQLIDDVIPRIVETQWRVVSDLGVKKTTALIALLGNLTDVLSAAGNGASDD